jgi:hypothetical protein
VSISTWTGGASQFLSKQFFVGLVGYAYDQVSADSGAGDRVGAFESRVFSVGPQLGYIFPVAGKQGFLGLKSYFEFGAKNRPEGLEYMAYVRNFGRAS